MFPLITFIISLLVVLGMIIYQVDIMRLKQKGGDANTTFPEFRIFKKIRNFFEEIFYVVAIRVYKFFRKIQRKLRKKN